MARDDQPYTLVITRTARRQLSETLPEPVAVAAYGFIESALLVNPERVGKRLRPPMQDDHSARRGDYRVIYRIDEQRRTVIVLSVSHRRVAYRA